MLQWLQSALNLLSNNEIYTTRSPHFHFTLSPKHQINYKREFLGCRRIAVEFSVLLECAAASLDDWRLTFRDSVVVSATREKRSWTIRPLTLKPLICLETSGTNHPATRHHIPEVPGLQITNVSKKKYPGKYLCQRRYVKIAVINCRPHSCIPFPTALQPGVGLGLFQELPPSSPV